jgi:hypothetical protein
MGKLYLPEADKLACLTQAGRTSEWCTGVPVISAAAGPMGLSGRGYTVHGGSWSPVAGRWSPGHGTCDRAGLAEGPSWLLGPSGGLSWCSALCSARSSGALVLWCSGALLSSHRVKPHSAAASTCWQGSRRVAGGLAGSPCFASMGVGSVPKEDSDRSPKPTLSRLPASQPSQVQFQKFSCGESCQAVRPSSHG